MKKLLSLPIVIAICLFTRIDSAYAVDYPFSVTTLYVESGWTFEFYLSAQGTFYVDCGTDGTLSSDNSTANAMISGGTINKTDTTSYPFKCTYSSDGAKMIRFGGTATNYNTDTITAAISFYTSAANPAFITSISGNISTIFPYISGNAADGAQPRFYRTFYPAKNITSIPDTLFSGYTVASTAMFASTFNGCTGLTSIPANLFFPNATSVSGANDMFAQTFAGCKGLTSIPANLFSKITSGATYMFYNTFYACSNLTGFIPPTLFDGLIKNNAATNTFYNTFGSTRMDTSCSAGTQYASTYTSAWGGKVSCLVPINMTFDGASPMSCNFGSTFVPPTPTARPGYIFTGWKIKKPSCAQQIQNLDPSIAGTVYGYTSLSGSAGGNESNYGLTTGSGQWAVQFSYGTVWGMTKCSETSGDNSSFTWPESSKSNWLKTPSDTAGGYCWCQATGFTATASSYTSGPQCTTTASSLWVFFDGYGSSDYCADHCANNCANFVRNYAALRAAVFGAAGQ